MFGIRPIYTSATPPSPHSGWRHACTRTVTSRSAVTTWPPKYVATHDWLLAANWDAVVQPDDHVWVLGDLSMGGTEAVARALNWVGDRPGVKHLITGNHDACWPGHRDAHTWQATYMRMFASVQPFGRRKIAGRNVMLSHFPIRGDHTTADRFWEYRLRDGGLPILHGHTHAPRKTSLMAAFPVPRLQIHVGVDAWNLFPVNQTEIADRLAAYDALWTAAEPQAAVPCETVES